MQDKEKEVVCRLDKQVAQRPCQEIGSSHSKHDDDPKYWEIVAFFEFCSGWLMPVIKAVDSRGRL